MSRNLDLGLKALWREPWGFLRLEGAMPKLRMLFIGHRERNQIARAIERARARPNRLADVLPNAQVIDGKPYTLADRKPGQKIFPGISVMIPLGYRAAISFEYQPTGLYRHLSISVDEHGKLPHQAAVEEIAKAFGFSKIEGGWLEEFEPGHFAVNVLEEVEGVAG